MNTTATLIREWEDEPEEGRTADDWPFPTSYRKFAIDGDLADRIRARLGEPEGTPVYLTERTESGGWSEWTQEDELYFTIECGSNTVSFDEYSPRVGYGATTVARLSAWLNEQEAQK